MEHIYNRRDKLQFMGNIRTIVVSEWIIYHFLKYFNSKFIYEEQNFRPDMLSAFSTYDIQRCGLRRHPRQPPQLASLDEEE